MRSAVAVSIMALGCNAILGQRPGIADDGGDADASCACMLDHATSACVEGRCRITGCDDGWEDVDRDPSNGCETADPLSVDGLALWLRGDRGVEMTNGTVVGWTNQAPGTGNVAMVTSGAPKLDTSSWPSAPGASSVHLGGNETFGVDLSAMMSKPGFTTFVAVARYGDYPYNCVLGSPTYPAMGFICGAPPDAAGTAFQLGWISNTKTFCEPFCSGMDLPIAANGASSYQAVVMIMWFDPSTPRSYHYSLDEDTTSIQSYVRPLTNLSAPSMLGGCPSGPRFTGLVGELVVYGTLLSKDDRDLVHSYLKARWKTP